MQLPERVEGLPSQRRGDGRILKIVYFLENYIMELMTGNVVISEVVALMYVVLSKAEKHVHYGELVGSTECITL
jgi:hypothetical protein